MIKYKPLPPIERLHELLEVVEIPPDKYGEWSGLFWKVNRGRQRAGSVAGTPQPTPSNPDRVDWRIRVDCADYIVSRIIYYVTHGKDPGSIQVDHEDQNWLNNNARNLRLDTDRNIQQVNSPKQRNNASGVAGMSWDKSTKKWKVQVLIENKRKYLGLFTCKIKAACVVRDKWVELNWDKLGRKLPDLNKIQCECSDCSNMTARPSDPAE